MVEISNAVPARYCALVLFLGETGLRIGEAVAVRVRDINLDERPVRVRDREDRGTAGSSGLRKTLATVIYLERARPTDQSADPLN